MTLSLSSSVRPSVRNQGVFLSLKRICNDIEGDWEFEKLSRVFKKCLKCLHSLRSCNEHARSDAVTQLVRSFVRNQGVFNCDEQLKK